MNTTELIAIVLGSNVVVELVKRFFDWVSDKEKQEDIEKSVEALKVAVRALCEDRLGVLLRDWLHDDVRTAQDWKIIEGLYAGYDALAGNGEIKILYKEASDIKTTE